MLLPSPLTRRPRTSQTNGRAPCTPGSGAPAYSRIDPRSRRVAAAGPHTRHDLLERGDAPGLRWSLPPLSPRPVPVAPRRRLPAAPHHPPNAPVPPPPPPPPPPSPPP